MAFPVPEHLPRKQLPADLSSRILTKISNVTNKSLTAELAAEWISDLELGIHETEDRIYKRVHEELPDFERQLESSKSVQTRLRDLSANVDRIAEALEDPKTGLLPTLLDSLRAHKGLAQRASDAQVTYEALVYLNECRVQFESLRILVEDGHLAEGVTHGNDLSVLLEHAPEALATADVMADMRNQLRTLKDQMQEQLSEAYSRSVQISSTELYISPSVQVRQAQTIISLRDILASLSSTSLNSHLTSLRRDIVAHFIDFPLQQASSSNVSNSSDADGTSSIVFSIFPLPPSPTFRNSTPAYLRSLFDFLRENLFSVLPLSVASSFPQSLYKPTATALLRDVIVPSLPSSLAGLHSFLNLVQDATQFEQDYFFSPDAGVAQVRGEGEIRDWVRGVAGHYGRKRRIDLLAEARKLILAGTDNRTVRVEVPESPEAKVVSHVPDVIPVQGEIGGGDEAENGWDFDDDQPSSNDKVPTNGKPLEGEEQTKRHEASDWDVKDDDTGVSDQTKVDDDAQDDSDAWGWGDEEETSTPATSENGNIAKHTQPTNGHGETRDREASDDSAWDSAWDEPEPAPPSPPVRPISPAKAPKVAKGLEKLTAKGKQKGFATPTASSNPRSSSPPSTALPSSFSPSSHPFSPSRPQPSPSVSSSARSTPQVPTSVQSAPLKPPALNLPRQPKPPETYLISGHVQDLIRLISDTISEGRAITASTIFSDFALSSPDATSYASTFVFQVAPAALDLYRAVYPVAFATELSRPARALRFANDCMYMHGEVAIFELPSGTAASVHEQMREALERLHALGAWWFDEGVERECERVLRILSRAEGFVDTGDQERFDDCEAVMSEVLHDVRTATGEWKTILPRGKWLQAAGRVVETALTRVLDDILAIPDIPEVDSRRLSELCRILSALEGLFVDAEDPEAPSMVLDYVPSWLKYSYLSELLEATIADISYLFDEGALIDFTIDELVRLVRALFADTPLRSNTIAKLQRGHPVPVE